MRPRFSNFFQMEIGALALISCAAPSSEDLLEGTSNGSRSGGRSCEKVVIFQTRKINVAENNENSI